MVGQALKDTNVESATLGEDGSRQLMAKTAD